MPSDIVSAAIGLVSGLLVLTVGKAIDQWNTARARELDIATIVGELRAGFGSQMHRLQSLEDTVAGQSRQLSRLEARISDIADMVGQQSTTYHLTGSEQ